MNVSKIVILSLLILFGFGQFKVELVSEVRQNFHATPAISRHF